jgi:hypothetical protein
MAPALLTTLLAATAPAALRSRDDSSTGIQHGVGIVPPADINNTALFALFGLIPAACIVVGIWFFFIAKNGGFRWKETDWDDYKSTVLRRRGPNGTLLSGATPTTWLGGGSVYKDVRDHEDVDDMHHHYRDIHDDGATTVFTGTTGLTGITAGPSEPDKREARRRKQELKERERERKREQKRRDKEKKKNPGAAEAADAAAGGLSGARRVGPDGLLIDEEAEQDAKEKLRQYRHEKPARVGGINKQSEGSAWDGSTNPSHSSVQGTSSDVTSGLMGYRDQQQHQRTPPTRRERGDRSMPSSPATPTRPERAAGAGGGIRKVYSTADKREDRIRAEARKLQDRGRAATAAAGGVHSRDFSYQRVDTAPGTLPSEATSPGFRSYAEESSDLRTKVYRHSVHFSTAAPSSSSPTTAATSREERRKKRASGYRRGHDLE